MTNLEERLLRGMVDYLGFARMLHWLAALAMEHPSVPREYRHEIRDRLTVLAKDLEE